MYQTDALPIKAWAEEDRPREKMLLRGKQNLSDAELLAILLGSGSREESAVALARRILHAVSNSLHELGKLSVTDLTSRFKGVGEAKAVAIVAAIELGRRRQLSEVHRRPQVRSSKDCYEAMAPLLADLPHEEFWILLLNHSNHIIGRECISTGSATATVVDAKAVFFKALEYRAAALVLVHNHPSGTLRPSRADKELTHKLFEAGRILDIAILDHLIIAEKEYFSFSDENILCPRSASFHASGVVSS